MNYVKIEYCVMWNYTPEFDRVSNIISSIDSAIDVSGNESKPRSGSFEVIVNGKLLFSKFKMGRFPNDAEIYSWFG